MGRSRRTLLGQAPKGPGNVVRVLCAVEENSSPCISMLSRMEETMTAIMQAESHSSDSRERTAMKSCPRCQSEQSWALGDGRLKCRGCGMRYSWRSVWDGLRLPDEAKHGLL